MPQEFRLEQLKDSHHLAARAVYADAIESHGGDLYSKKQIAAWSALAWLPGILDRPLNEGNGWAIFENEALAAFAVRFPQNRLALLYCRGKSIRRGYATILLHQVELDARAEGQKNLFADASLFSYSLLLKYSWSIIYPEKISIGGIEFDRYLMKKVLD